MVSFRLPLALLAAVVLAAPAGAFAQDTNAPPGNSGIDEYLETVPKAGGDQPPRRLGNGNGAAGEGNGAAGEGNGAAGEGKGAAGEGAGSSLLSSAERERLERLGRDGRVLADVIEATGPRTARDGNPARSLPEATGRSPLDKAFQALGGSDDGDGLGVLLPAILLATLLGTLALVLVRRRSAS